MNYSGMTDLKINEAVLEALYGGGPEYRITDDGKLIIQRHVNTVEFGEHVEHVVDGAEFDPCNSWAEAGPIIQDYKINLTSTPQGWCASDSGRHDVNVYPHNNPLRAAMIVFLMMQEKVND